MRRKNRKNKKKKVGVTFSSFDLCHAGHIRMLKDCKNVCDYLIVGLQDDPSQEVDLQYRLETREAPKNPPIMSVEERKEILEAIKYVDEIFIYSTEEDLLNWLKTHEFDVRILGSDWKGKKYTGWDIPHLPYFHERNHNFSTSSLRARVHRAEEERLRALRESEVKVEQEEKTVVLPP